MLDKEGNMVSESADENNSDVTNDDRAYRQPGEGRNWSVIEKLNF